MRSEQETIRAIERYSDTVQRLCMVHLKNDADTEDIFQTVFLKYVLSSVSFENDEHEKAWFIRVTINACKDFLKSFFRSHTVSLDNVMEQSAELPPLITGMFGKPYFHFLKNIEMWYICTTLKIIPPRRLAVFWRKCEYDLYAPDSVQTNVKGKAGRCL